MDQRDNNLVFRLGPGVLLAGFLVLLTLVLGGALNGRSGLSAGSPRSPLESTRRAQGRRELPEVPPPAAAPSSPTAPVPPTLQVAARIATKKGVHREVTGDCQVCHAEHQGVDADLRPLDPKDFDHRAETGFPLGGNHAALAGRCPACHKTRSYLNNRPNCDSCHADPHRGGMTESCQSCQAVRSAGASLPAPSTRPASSRSRAVISKFLAPPATSTASSRGTPTRCYDCHWIRRQDDPYRTRLGNGGGKCHRPTSWTAVLFDHGSRTGMPLNGAHRNLNCDACHKDRIFTGAPSDCYSCHHEDPRKQMTRNQPWAPVSRPRARSVICRHARAPRRRLVQPWLELPPEGEHATQHCAACHNNRVYHGTSRDCYGCHRSSYERTRRPQPCRRRVLDGLRCLPSADRYAPSSPASFNHCDLIRPSENTPPSPAAACHRNERLSGAPRDCYGCHRSIMTEPGPQPCRRRVLDGLRLCHRPTDRLSTRGHSTTRPFAPQGVHAAQACSRLPHQRSLPGHAPRLLRLHGADYENARDPNHVAAGFPTTCDACHRASDSSFDQGRFQPLLFPDDHGPPRRGFLFRPAIPTARISRSSAASPATAAVRPTRTTPEDPGARLNSQACYSCHPQGRA